MRETATRYGAPFRPRLVRLLNHAGRLAATAGRRRPLAAAELMGAAAARFGLHDFDGDDFREPLRRLVRAVEQEARLHPLGRRITAERLVGTLGNRLRAAALFRQHPEILQAAVARPLVITGLQRTGTTLLHRLLAADPQTRALRSWEAINPAPFLPWRPGGADRRPALARLAQRALAYMAPDFFAVHPVEAGAPEEDSLLLDFSLLSPVAEATLRVPSYARWLQGQPMEPAYRYLARLLSLLQWQAPARRWVLKTPVHQEHLGLLLRLFPGALIIHTHRDPARTLPSFCSMVAHGRGVFSDHVDPLEIGAEWLSRQARMARAAMAARADPAVAAAVVDVPYPELLRDPLGVARRIYAAAGLRLCPPAERAMAACLRRNPQHRHGRHRYRLEDFGLDRASVRRAFAPYYAAFIDGPGGAGEEP